MHDFAGETPLDRAEVRKRLERMSDSELRRWGVAARHMCSPEANFGRPPRQNFVLQLEEAIAEWKRRHGTGAPETAPGRPKPRPASALAVDGHPACLHHLD